jgi:Asp-tRNA(Asn)/Glu-tRNA(Gln) amidotransferase A subunit family amidase
MKTRRLVALLLSVLLSETARAQGPERLLVPDELRMAGALNGLELTDAELELMLDDVARQMAGFARMREIPLDNSVPTALVFDPLGYGVSDRSRTVDGPGFAPVEATRPEDLEELAFADVATLASLVRSRAVSCVELCEMYLARLHRLDATLHCVITFTDERALARARALDEELASGTWRGPLHGIPWGAKDLLATKGVRTTWGAKPFEDQVIELDAAVVERLDAAGAVLIAKLTLGALALGDVWFGETTRNPWNPEQGSSGSSAGPASATAAGCVAFAIGSETLGSIVSPSVRCGVSSLRPTFGRVSRHGAMALSWSMDKLGPMCRSVADAGIVLEAIAGVDPRDAHTREPGSGPFRYAGRVDVAGWRVGYPAAAFEASERDGRVLDELRALGVELVPIAYPEYPVRDMTIVLMVEAAAAFDEITRDGRDELLVRQTRDAWPNTFRAAQLVPAVEYVRASRLRAALMREMDAVFAKVDLVVHPAFYGLTTTNLTGHPTVVVPSGFAEDRTPYSIAFTGQLFGEQRLVALAQAWQESTGYHRRHPDLR